MVYCKYVKSSSQPPIFSPVTTAGWFFWSDNNDVPLRCCGPFPTNYVQQWLSPRVPPTDMPSDCATITTDNSQPPISSTDITAGPLDGDDDSTEYNEASSDDESLGFHTTLNDFWYSQAPYNTISLDSDDDEIPIGGKIDEEEDYVPTLTPPRRRFDARQMIVPNGK